MKSQQPTLEERRKMRKSLVISQWLYESMKRCRRLSLTDVEGIIISLRIGGIPNTGSFDDLTWTMPECRAIVEQSMVYCIEPKKLTTTIYNALNSESLIAPPNGVQLKWCCGCRKERKLTDFTSPLQRQCKRCKKITNSWRSHR